jgi:aminoglycoside phosphotransferase (APT) family kinase protein
MSLDAARADALGGWLRVRLEGAKAVTVTSIATPKSGFSGETTMIDATVERESGSTDERFVLRIETPEPPVYPVQSPGWSTRPVDIEIEVQYAVMEAIGRTGAAPVAPMIGFEPDATVLGAPFFVMGYIGGVVPIESPPYTTEGFFLDASPDDRTRMILGGIEAMAAVHRIDWQQAGLGWLNPEGVEPGAARQLQLWEGYATRELAGRSHPLLVAAFAWLHAHLPPPEPVGLSWGDPRPGNIIWQDHTAMCLTDFEAASIAPPLHDLGWWLMFDRTMHEEAGVDRLAGDPTRDEQRSHYFATAGRPEVDTYFWEVFAAARYTAIVVRVMNRLSERGLLPSDSMIWLENPASACLSHIFEP